ncbi:MAG: NAD(P)/FAD-dependent oxidoreductase, partial [Candidatus Bathyarchaeota archaeon]
VNCKIQDTDRLETYVGRKVAPLGYAWVFPKGSESANVGLGVRGAPAKPYLDRFISRHPDMFRNSKIIEIQAAPVPIGGQIKNTVYENIMLCGDAAGQVIPLTGGGIHSSLAAGKIAGEVAGKAIASMDFNLDEYPAKYNQVWAKRFFNSLYALRMIERLNDNDLNRLPDILTGQDIVDLASGFNFDRVRRKLLKHPAFTKRLTKALLNGRD